jgi:hypothetical protein
MGKQSPLAARGRRQITAVHDRRATQLPKGAVAGVVEIDDPYERGGRISAVANLRDDPLGLMWARHQIDDAKFMAGRHWQKFYAAAEVGMLRSVDLSRERVDGGARGGEILTERRKRAMATLRRCRDVLGEEGDLLVRDVLGHGRCLTEVATGRGLGRRSLEYLGARLRECLESLAKTFGYA